MVQGQYCPHFITLIHSLVCFLSDFRYQALILRHLEDIFYVELEKIEKDTKHSWVSLSFILLLML